MAKKQTSGQSMTLRSIFEKSILDNINGLSLGDRAHCGPYGIVTCTHAAEGRGRGKAPRKFSVSRSKKLQNRGNWTMRQLREAITA